MPTPLRGDASTPEVATWPVLSTRLRFTLQQVAVSQANLSISDRGTLGLLMRAFERWSGAKIALGWTGMVHGDVQGNNLLVGSGCPPTITWVDWEDAGRGLWLFDLANLTHLCDIPVRNRLLREYWRAVGGKPGQLQGFVHDINQMLWERWMEKLAWILLQRAEFGGQDLDCIDFQRLREALDLGMQHPVRAADILAERN